MVQGSCDVIHLTSSILLLSCLISSDFLAPPWARKFFLVGARISSLKLTLQVWCRRTQRQACLAFAEPPPTLAVASQMQRQRYDNGIAVHESAHKKIFFSKINFVLKMLTAICYTCYSVTVLERAFHFLIKLLYLYINIELIFNIPRLIWEL